MSLILHSNATSGQAAVAHSRAPAPRDEQARQQPLSFEEVLVRSLTVDLETAEKVAVKTPPSAPTRRQSVERKDDPAELANAITLTMVALDGGSIKIAGKDLPEGHADDQASLSQGSQPAGPQTLAPDRAALASTTRRPGLRLAPAMTTPAAKTAATAVEAMAVQARPSAAGADSTATTGARPTALQGEPALPAKQQLDGQAALQVTLAAASDKPTLAPDAGTLSAQVSLPAYGNADQASDGDAGSANSTAALASLQQRPESRLAPAMTTPPASTAATPVTDTSALASLPQRPGSRLAPAMTSPAAMTAATAVEAMAVQARPSAAGADSTATTGARPTALQGEPALPAKQQLDGQAALQVTLAAASDKPALAPDAGTLSAQTSLPAYGNADQASDGAAGSANSRSPMAVMSASLTAAVASSILPVDAHAGPKRLAPDAGPGTSMRRGQGLRGEPASTGVRSTTSLAAPTVKPTEPSFSPNEAPLAADTPLTGPATEPRSVPGSPTKADRSAPQADGAAVADALTPTAEAGTSAGQASASAHSMPGAASFSRNENWLTNPLSGATTSSPTGVGASITADSVTRSPRLTPEVGSQEWDKALGQQVVQMGKAGQQVTELQLNPPGLGPLKVTLEMNNHQMQVMFVSAHASVRAAVEAAVPQLRANLADSGISLGNTSVSSESQAQTAFAQPQNSAPRHQAYRNNSQPRSPNLGAPALTGARQRNAGLGVDTYA